MEIAKNLSQLSVLVLSLRVDPKQDLILPRSNMGNTLRGAFGIAFRQLVCVPQCKETRRCPLNGSCPYKVIFEPSPPIETGRLSKNQDAPRPFIFRPPLSGRTGISPAPFPHEDFPQTTYRPGKYFEFGLVLLGKAVGYLPYFVLAFRDVARQGIGLNRASCELRDVTAQACDGKPAHVVYSFTDQLFRSPAVPTLSGWLNERRADSLPDLSAETAARVTIRFLTPTHLRFEEQTVLQPDFHPLFKRVRDRLNALCTFYGPGPIEADFRGLGERAEQIRTIHSNVRWVELERRSSKTHQRHELSGFVGECTYEGDLAEFLPWLAAGQAVHVGRHTAWGNGWYQATAETVVPRHSANREVTR